MPSTRRLIPLSQETAVLMENKYIFNFLIVISLLTLFSNLKAQDGVLKLVKESNGIRVFKEKNAHDNINRIVAQMTVDANYLQVLCLIKDFPHKKDWIYANHGAFCMDSISPYHWIFYGISEIPWPLLDRDVVADVHLELDHQNQTITIHSVAAADLVPASPDMVRIEMFDSKWRIQKKGKQSLVELDMLVDVGGNVPVWLVNMFASNGPMQTFKNMQKELKNKDLIQDCGYHDFFE